MTENANVCVYCGAPLANEAIVCDTCGKPVNTAQPAQPTPAVFTPPFTTTPPIGAQPAARPVTPPVAQPAQAFTPPPAQPAQAFTPPPARQAQAYSPPPAQQAPPAAQPAAPARKNGAPLALILGGIGCVVLVCVGMIVAAAVYFVQTRESTSIISQLIPTQLATLNAIQEPTSELAATSETQPQDTAAPAEATAAAPSNGSAANPGTWSADIGQQLTDSYFAENFANANNDWAEVDDATRTWAYEDQRYALHLKEADYVAWAYLPVDFTPLGVGFDAALAPGFEQGAFGVLCHYQDQDNYHYVAIDPVNQEYAIGKFVDNEDTMLLDDWWKPAQHLEPSADAVNRIKVICRLDKISLYINDQLETEVAIEPAFPGRMAVYAETWEDMPAEGFKVLFDNLYANLQEP